MNIRCGSSAPQFNSYPEPQGPLSLSAAVRQLIGSSGLLLGPHSFFSRVIAAVFAAEPFSLELLVFSLSGAEAILFQYKSLTFSFVALFRRS